MKTRSVTFEELPIAPLTLDIYYAYYYVPARINCRNDDACPEEEESILEPPNNFEDIVRAHYLKAAEEGIKHIENILLAMNNDNIPKEWTEEYSADNF